MGGLVTRAVTSRDDFEETLNFIKSATFIASPFKGSPLADLINKWVLKQLIFQVKLNNPQGVLDLSERSAFVRSLEHRIPKVPTHLIVGTRVRWNFDELSYKFLSLFHNKNWKKLRKGFPFYPSIETNDGPVSLTSATALPGTLSELRLPYAHSPIMGTQEAFDEIKRILLLHEEKPVQPAVPDGPEIPFWAEGGDGSVVEKKVSPIEVGKGFVQLIEEQIVEPIEKR